MSGRTRPIASRRAPLAAWAVRIAALLVACQVAVTCLGVVEDPAREAASNALSAVIPLLAAIAVRPAVRPGAPTARAWHWITLGLVGWGCGAAIWFVRSLLVDGSPPATGPEDVGYLALSALLVLALADGARQLGAAARCFLDGVLIVAALAVAL